MKRRIAADINAYTGLGGGGPSLMDGKSTGNKKRDKIINQASTEFYELFLKGTTMDYEICDAGVRGDTVTFGYEPSYMYERLKTVTIEKIKGFSCFTTGYSFGGWGTGIRKTDRVYALSLKKSKFIKFVDKWHPLLFP